MRIGIFGGTFDPVHNGHVHLVQEMSKALHLDLIIVVVANLSPFKLEYPPIAKAIDRLEMVKLAFREVKGVVVSPIEINRGGTSYTIDTVKKILKDYPDDEMFLLLTQDAVDSFENWKDSHEIESLVKVVFAIDQNSKFKFDNRFFCSIPWVRSSSTEVRNRLFAREDGRQFLSPKVLDYIAKHQLYSRAYDNE